MKMVLVLSVILASWVVSCGLLSPYPNPAGRCGTDGSCPAGYQCQDPDGLCWRAGTGPDLAVPDLAVRDLAVPPLFHVVVLRVGDGIDRSGKTAPVFLERYDDDLNPVGDAGVWVGFPQDGGFPLTLNQDNFSEGQIQGSFGQRYLVVPAYGVASGVDLTPDDMAVRDTSPRVIALVDRAGQIQAWVIGTGQTVNGTLRSAAYTEGKGAWVSGEMIGITFFGDPKDGSVSDGAPIVVAGGSVRVVRRLEDGLLYASSSGPKDAGGPAVYRVSEDGGPATLTPLYREAATDGGSSPDVTAFTLVRGVLYAAYSRSAPQYGVHRYRMVDGGTFDPAGAFTWDGGILGLCGREEADAGTILFATTRKSILKIRDIDGEMNLERSKPDPGTNREYRGIACPR